MPKESNESSQIPNGSESIFQRFAEIRRDLLAKSSRPLDARQSLRDVLGRSNDHARSRHGNRRPHR